VWLALSAAVAGCATVRRQADAALERKSYVEAAELYDEALLDNPKDETALARRAQAREAALAEVLEEARVARERGSMSEARGKLGRFFRLRHRWVMSTPPALVGPLKQESTAAAMEMAEGVRKMLTADAPLAAEAALHADKVIVAEPELAVAVRELGADIRVAGQKRCDHYLSQAGSKDGSEQSPADRPYWRWLVARYCQHFGREATVPALPNLASGVDLAGTISGVSDASATALGARLASALVGTPWYAPGVGERVAGELHGAYAVAYQHGPVTENAPWTERVAYQAMEPRSVPHQVSRMESETYWVTVPYTVTQSETYSCGDSHSYRTCTRSKSVFRTRSESRSRLVTRWHTEYRTELQTVTRHKDVPRVFQYQAERYQANYTLASTVTMHLPPDGEPLTVPLARRELVQALRTDVTFLPAGISPTSGRVPSADQWLNAALDPMLEGVKRELRQAWTARFCTREEFTVEEAARCLYGSKAGAAATEALRSVSGAEADALTALALGPQR
jgi:hypothetical protein